MELIFKGKAYVDSMKKIQELKSKYSIGWLVLKKSSNEVSIYFEKDSSKFPRDKNVIQVISIKSPIETIQHNFRMTDIVLGNVENPYIQKDNNPDSYYEEWKKQNKITFFKSIL